MGANEGDLRWWAFLIGAFGALALYGVAQATFDPNPPVAMWVLEVTATAVLVSLAAQVPLEVAEAVIAFGRPAAQPSRVAWLRLRSASTLPSAAWSGGLVLAAWSAMRWLPAPWFVSAFAVIGGQRFLQAALAPWAPGRWPGVSVASSELGAEVGDLAGLAGLAPLSVRIQRIMPGVSQSWASISGMGRHVMLTIIEPLAGAPLAERQVVIAHELGHHRGRHVRWIASVIAVVGVADVCGLAFAGAGGHGFALGAERIPLFLFFSLFAGVATSPAVAWFSRRQEASADRFALDLTGDPDAFIRAFSSMGADRVASGYRPDVTFGSSHPTIPDRIKAAKQWKPSLDQSGIQPIPDTSK